MIKKIQIKNYKGIKDVTLDDLSHINYLVGANGSGKSSFFQCLQYLMACELDALNKEMVLNCQVEKDFSDMEGYFKKDFYFYIESYYENKPLIIEISGKPLVQIKSKALRFKIITSQGVDWSMNIFENLNLKYIDTHNASFRNEIINSNKQVYFSTTDTNRNQTRLEKSIEELNKLLKYIFKEKFEIKKIGEEYFIVTETIRDKINLTELSAGIRTLAILKNLFLWNENFNPMILLIEEPETSLHPRIQKKIAKELDQFWRKTNKKGKINNQIIVSTHSPFILAGTKEVKPISGKRYKKVFDLINKDKDNKYPSLIQKAYLLNKGKNLKLKSGIQGKNILTLASKQLGYVFEDFISKTKKTGKFEETRTLFVFVEGDDDKKVLEFLLKYLYGHKYQNIIIRQCGSARDVIDNYYFLKDTIKKAISINEENVTVIGIIDRSCSEPGIQINGKNEKTNGTETFNSTQRSNFIKENRGNIYMWERREIENYIYDPEVVSEVFGDKEEIKKYKKWLFENKIDIKTSEIKKKIGESSNTSITGRKNALQETKRFKELLRIELDKFLSDVL